MNIPTLETERLILRKFTLIASLASVISFRCYTSSKGAHAGAYLKTFTIYNIIFLAVCRIQGN